MLNEGSGGALFIYNSNVKISQCVFEDNSALYAGAINGYKSSITIEECSFTNNEGINDIGSIWSMGEDPKKHELHITNSNFTNNKANRFGAICSNYTNLMISNCLFEGNRGNEAVGALGIIGSESATISCTSFIGNTCGRSSFEVPSPTIWIQEDKGNGFKLNLIGVCFFGNKEDNSILNGIAMYTQKQTQISLIYNEFVCFDGDKENFIMKTDKIVLEESGTEYMRSNQQTQNECIMEIYPPSETSTEEESSTSSSHETSESPSSSSESLTESSSSHEEISTSSSETSQTYSEISSSSELSSETSQASSEESSDSSTGSSSSSSETSSEASSEESSESSSEESSEASSEEASSQASSPAQNPDISLPLGLGMGLGLLLLLLLLLLLCCCCKKRCQCCKCCCKCCCRCKRRRKSQKISETNNYITEVFIDDKVDFDDYIIFNNPKFVRLDPL
ncbi:hypothetical protein GPJ56_006658 [Histomonas meleagridis]|uniref:uncharacterized protein n=1 Tax=Histomonas meleagridis TaxID=135588 RepID=UPI003559E4BB|nr:hypothetical protein GPJ56_006658 [Histomonas meleagridis]KAH0803669.1 hypothetical protein GO595_003553 [Histomonas meleagridis]